MAKIDRRQLAQALHAAGLSEPVMILPEMMPDENARESWEGITTNGTAAIEHTSFTFTIDKVKPNVWYYMSDDLSHEFKVHQKKDRITCGCDAFRKSGKIGCRHVGDYCRQNGLPDPTGGKQWRRLELPFLVYPQGMPSETTLKKQAYRTTRSWVRDKIYELCRSVNDHRRTGKPGRPPVHLRLSAYALLVKVMYNYTYEDLREELRGDTHFRKLGWIDEDPPHWNTLCDMMAERELLGVFESFIVTTSRPGRNVDPIIIFDGSGFGTCPNQHWMHDRKHASKDQQQSNPKKQPPTPTEPQPRAKRRYLKLNASIGGYSGLIYALTATMDKGYGTADNEHFETLFTRTAKNCNFDITLADMGYYDEENYALCERHGKLLFVLPKKGTKPETSNTPAQAFIAWLIKEHPAVFRRFYRYRPLIEGTFSRGKRKNGHIKLRKRAKELEWFKKMAYPFDPTYRYIPADRQRFRIILCRLIARERVGIAQRNEALCKAIGSNLRRLRWMEKIYNDRVDFAADRAFRPIPRVSPPSSPPSG